MRRNILHVVWIDPGSDWTSGRSRRLSTTDVAALVFVAVRARRRGRMAARGAWQPVLPPPEEGHQPDEPLRVAPARTLDRTAIVTFCDCAYRAAVSVSRGLAAAGFGRCSRPSGRTPGDKAIWV
jgi:hypothetical protein